MVVLVYICLVFRCHRGPQVDEVTSQYFSMLATEKQS